MENNQGSSEVSLKEAFLYWFKLGFINFGGPAGQIAMITKTWWMAGNGSVRRCSCGRSISACYCRGRKHTNWRYT